MKEKNSKNGVKNGRRIASLREREKEGKKEENGTKREGRERGRKTKT